MSANKARVTGAVLTFIVLGFTCSNPWVHSFSRVHSNQPAQTSKLGGVINIPEGCTSPLAQITLQGVLNGANIRVETQSDSTGHFSLEAPAGNYILHVEQGTCRTQEEIHLEASTDHRVSLNLEKQRPVDEETDVPFIGGRFPASLLVSPKK